MFGTDYDTHGFTAQTILDQIGDRLCHTFLNLRAT
jgi:hypothetical protein